MDIQKKLDDTSEYNVGSKLVIITSYPTRVNGIIVLVNSQTGFCCRFLFPQFYKGKFLNLAHYFPYDVKLRLLTHSWSFFSNQRARNAIVSVENLLNDNNQSYNNIIQWQIYSSVGLVVYLFTCPTVFIFYPC